MGALNLNSGHFKVKHHSSRILFKQTTCRRQSEQKSRLLSSNSHTKAQRHEEEGFDRIDKINRILLEPQRFGRLDIVKSSTLFFVSLCLCVRFSPSSYSYRTLGSSTLYAKSTTRFSVSNSAAYSTTSPTISV